MRDSRAAVSPIAPDGDTPPACSPSKDTSPVPGQPYNAELVRLLTIAQIALHQAKQLIAREDDLQRRPIANAHHLTAYAITRRDPDGIVQYQLAEGGTLNAFEISVTRDGMVIR